MSLPQEIVNLLKNSKYLHLATCSNNVPSVSLMNYTYLDKGDASPHEQECCIVLTTPKDTQKFKNLSANSNVSLLVHDWTSARSMVESNEGVLSQMLRNLNQSAMSNLSVTLDGTATLVSDPQAIAFFKNKHQENNNDSKDQCFMDESTEVILVKPTSATAADAKNQIQTYNL